MTPDYFAAIRAAESGGNDRARNPRSTATGRYQFIKSTWDELARKYPNLGLTDRLDPAQQERAIRAFTADNARILRNAGIATSGGNLYAAHFLGAGGAIKVLSQPDNVALTQVLPPEVIRANPFLQGMTVGRFRQWTASKGGKSAPGPDEQAPTMFADNALAQPPAEQPRNELRLVAMQQDPRAFMRAPNVLAMQPLMVERRNLLGSLT